LAIPPCRPKGRALRSARVAALTIERDLEGDVAVLRLRGDLDRLASDAVDAAVRELAVPGPQPMVLDVRHVEFIDSAGLRSIARAHRLLQSVDRTLIVRAPSAGVMRLFELVGLREILTIESG
jgi:anti-anti-sigma factor